MTIVRWPLALLGAVTLPAILWAVAVLLASKSFVALFALFALLAVLVSFVVVARRARARWGGTTIGWSLALIGITVYVVIIWSALAS